MATVYWFGGTGDWSDQANHWSNNSGNSPASLHGSVPGEDDNVIFDANSFSGASQVVTVGSTLVECNNINFTGATGNPVLDATSASFYVYGNITLISGMSVSCDDVWFINVYGEGTHYLNFAGINLSGLDFYSEGGDIVLTGDMDATGGTSQESYIEFGSGTLDTDGYDVKTGGWFECYDATALSLGDSIITLNGEITGTAYFEGPGTGTFDCGTSTIVFDIDTLGGESNTYLYSECGNVFYNIWVKNSGDAGVTFYEGTYNEIKIDEECSALFNGTITVSSLVANGSLGKFATLNSYYSDVGDILDWDVNALGSGYTVDDLLVISGGNDKSYIGIYEVDEDGVPTGYYYDSEGGLGYSVSNNVSTSGGTGSGFTINITEVGPLQFTLSKSSGVVSCDYLDLSNSLATGGARWYAGAHSNNTTGNSGWVFSSYNLKSYNTNLAANIKTICTNAIANTKTLNTNS